MFFVGWITLVLVLASGFTAFAQSQPKGEPAIPCGQEPAVQEPIIETAETNQFNVRRVEISGNSSIRHREFVNRLKGVNEGDIFSRALLRKSVERIARMKKIYPITMRNVELRVNPQYRDVDILICVKERKTR